MHTRLGDTIVSGKLTASIQTQDHHAASHTITHHGFSEEHIKKIFEDAGAGTDFALETIGVAFNKATEQRPEEVRRQVFIARGTKD